MSFIFTSGRTTLPITAKTEYDLTGATEVAILYKKPSGVTGELIGTFSGTEISANINGSEVEDNEGVWELQGRAVIDGETIYGTIAKEQIIIKAPIL